MPAAFWNCSGLTNVTIPGSVTNLGNEAFQGCESLARVFFGGDTPALGSYVFNGLRPTAYYLAGTSGWSNTFAGLPTALWFLPNPMILNNEPSLGVQSNGFGFMISWATNVSVVVEACTNLAEPAWVPVWTNSLTNGCCCFSDAEWTNYPGCFYRVRSP
jgi:hypothetical protein